MYRVVLAITFCKLISIILNQLKEQLVFKSENNCLSPKEKNRLYFKMNAVNVFIKFVDIGGAIYILSMLVLIIIEHYSI